MPEPKHDTPPNHALIQLLEAALLHPESAEGNIRQVIGALVVSEHGADLQSQLEQLRAENERLDNEPRLGCATTRQLLDELTARIEIHHSLDYRTTDPQMKYNLPAGGHTNE